MSEDVMMQEWEEEQEGFRVTDDQGAKWCIDQINAACKEYDEINEWYQAMIKKAMAKRDAKIGRMRNYLRDYADQVPMKETKTQRSYPIPGGKLVWRKAHQVYNHDDKLILEELKAHGRDDMIKRSVVERVDWMSLKKEIQETGEVIEGVTIEEVPDEFMVVLED